MEDGKARVGVSDCLLGDEVRYNGGHERDAFLTGPLAKFFDYVPVCPESRSALGFPALRSAWWAIRSIRGPSGWTIPR